MPRLVLLALAGLGAGALLAGPEPTFDRRTITTDFFSEGCAVGDLDGDGLHSGGRDPADPHHLRVDAMRVSAVPILLEAADLRDADRLASADDPHRSHGGHVRCPTALLLSRPAA